MRLGSGGRLKKKAVSKVPAALVPALLAGLGAGLGLGLPLGAITGPEVLLAWIGLTILGAGGLGGLASLVVAWRRQKAMRAAADPRIELEMFEHAELGWFEFAPDGAIHAINATMAGWLGCPVDAVDLSVFEIFRPASADDGRYRADLMPRVGEPFPVEVVIQSAPRPSGLRAALVTDLREIVRSVKALAESAERFGRYIDDAPVGIAALLTDGTIAEANPAFAVLVLGTPDAERLLGRRLGDLLVSPPDGPSSPADLQVVIGGNAGISVELCFRDQAERTARLFSTRAPPGRDGRSRIVFMIDVSAQKALEAQFVQSQKMQAVGQLAGGVAHDFNNLLTAILGYSDLLLARHKPDDESFPDLLQVKQNANRAANLVRQLLAFSRRQTLRPKTVDIRVAIGELSTLLRRLIGANITLDVIHADDLGLVKVDPGQFDQVIINLVVNARDAMPEGGRILIATRNVGRRETTVLRALQLPPGDYVAIDVTDTGTGIPREVLPNIFEPFFTTKAVGAGTGLGLSTVYGIVQQTGGSIIAESETGHGARFRILLPRLQVSDAGETLPAELGEARAEHEAAAQGTVLIVEDEDAVRSFAARALRRQGYQVLEAANGEDALAVINGAPETRLDLLITDVIMPAMDGPTLVKAVLQRQPGLKIVLISGYAEDAFRKDRDPGFPFTFLAKPFSLKQLGETVRQQISGR